MPRPSKTGDNKLNNVVTFTLGIFVGLGFAYLLQNGSGRNLQVRIEPLLTTPPEELPPKLMSGSETGGVKLLCWIMTAPKSHQTKAIHVKRTWGRRCDKLLFMSSANDSDLPAIALKNVKEGREYLWAKTKAAFKYVYQHHFDEFDWFMKADDDAFVIVDNLKNLLEGHDTNEPVWFGCRFKLSGTYGHMSGGPGYVLSKEALRRFAEIGLSNNSTHSCYRGHAGQEDMQMAKCLQKLGVEAGDSRDPLGRRTFFHYSLAEHLRPENTSDFVKYRLKHLYYPQTKGYLQGCCSDKPISFHYVKGSDFYVFDYLLNYVDSGVRTGKKNR